jgi:hypothetical protein
MISLRRCFREEWCLLRTCQRHLYFWWWRTGFELSLEGDFWGRNPSPLRAGEIEKMADKGILVVDHQPQGSLQALADRLADDLQDFDTGIPFAV